MRHICRTTLTAIIIAAAALPAQACYKVELKNTSEATVEAVWTSNGCFSTYDLQSLLLRQVCEHKKVHSDDFETYDYKWGTTQPVLDVVVKNASGKYVRVAYSYSDESFVADQKTPLTVPHCGLHYKITFNQQDWESHY